MTGLEIETMIVDETRSRYPEAVIEAEVERKGRVSLKVRRDHLLEVVKHLKERYDFSNLASVAGVDYPREKVFQVVYHVTSLPKKVTLTLKTEVPRDDPAVPSIIDVLPGADWHEQETHEMFGIDFEGNPNLGRLLLPEDWDEGYPLRKDFKLEK